MQYRRSRRSHFPIFLSLLVLCAVPAGAATGVSTEEGQSQRQSEKAGLTNAAEISSALKKSGGDTRQFNKSLNISGDTKVSADTSAQLQRARDRSVQLGVTRKRNVGAEALAILREELEALRARDPRALEGDSISELIVGVRPDRYGLTPPVRPGGAVDGHYASYLSTLAGQEHCGSLGGRFARYGELMRGDAVLVVATAPFLADAIAAASVEGKTMDELLEDVRLWIRARLPELLAGRYPVRGVKRLIGELERAREFCLLGKVETFRLGPCVVDLSTGPYRLTCEGREWWSPQGLAGVSAEISVSESYSVRQALNDTRGISQVSGVTTAVQDAAQRMRQAGFTQEASELEKTALDTVLSLEQGQDVSKKISGGLSLPGT